MQMLVLMLALGSAAFASAGVHAAGAPKSLVAGTVEAGYARNATTGDWCSVTVGASTFQRENATSPALITLDQVYYTKLQGFSGQPNYYLLSGQASLTFTSQNSGEIAFESRGYPANIQTLAFSNYKEKYSKKSGELTVSYVISFPTCDLGVASVYRN